MGQIAEIQRAMSIWRDYNFPEHTSTEQLLGVTEELGELAHVHLKAMQGIRDMADPQKALAAKEDAVADLFIFLTGYCSREGIDLERAILSTWAEVQKRDWIKYPGTGFPASLPQP